MYHWYLLCKANARAFEEAEVSGSRFLPWGGPKRDMGYSGKEETWMALPGLIEMLPLAGGSIIAALAESGWVSLIGIAIGFALTILVCWLLRNKIPPPPIHSGE